MQEHFDIGKHNSYNPFSIVQVGSHCLAFEKKKNYFCNALQTVVNLSFRCGCLHLNVYWCVERRTIVDGISGQTFSNTNKLKKKQISEHSVFALSE